MFRCFSAFCLLFEGLLVVKDGGVFIYFNGLVLFIGNVLFSLKVLYYSYERRRILRCGIKF